ncbi:MAG: type II toxin-antitoxin system VapC family toxin [candidate division NC10 bacterium]|nr:type II toxin-antitoxin system VapC family toxin [candidate division NC10 bacterium]MDE2321090.1 type II toxin-antitoxin system VapC family toxin [candidate division NC10 bacterium]
MILVDTSVWVDHLARGRAQLVELLHEGHVVCHPFVIGELACGHLRNRREILGLLAALPQARVTEHDELLRFVDQHQLSGRGLGWVDVHLLGGAFLSSCRLWTQDKALHEAARALRIAADQYREH